MSSRGGIFRPRWWQPPPVQNPILGALSVKLVATGALSATQAANTLAATAITNTKGALAATQAANSVSASGIVRVSAALAQTQADQTLSAAGVLPIIGSLSAFEAENLVSATGVTPAAGTLSQTQADQTLSATAIGSAATTGSLSQTQAAQTLSAAGSVLAKGALTQTQADQTLNAAGLVVIKGALAQTQGANTVSAAGITNTKGALAQTQADQTLSAAAITNTKGALATSVSWTFDTDVSGWSAVGSGAILTWDAANQRAQVETTAQQQGMSTTVPLPTGGDYRVDVTITNGASVSRSYRATMGAGLSGFATIPAGATQAVSFFIVGADSSTLVIRTGGIFTPAVGEKHYFDSVSVLLAQPGNIVSAAGVLPIKGTLTQTQQSHTSSGAAGADIEGALAATQADQTLAATGLSRRISGELAVTQADQTLAAAATTTGLNVTQDNQTLSATGTVTLSVAPCVLRAQVVVPFIVAAVEYTELSAAVSYSELRVRTCWDVVADREAA